MEQLTLTWSWLTEPLIALGQRIAVLTPNLLGALMLLVAGFVLSKLVAWVLRGVLARLGVDRLAEKSGLGSFLRNAGIAQSVSGVLGSIAYIFVLLAFAISAADALGLTAASAVVSKVLLFLPKFVAAIGVLVLGLVAAKLLSNLVRNAADNADIEYAPTLQRMSMGLLAALVVVLAVDQLDIRLLLLQQVIVIMLAAIGVALALSLGIGTRTLSGEIVSGVYIRDILEEGDRIEWNGVIATVLEVGTVKTSLRLADGRMMMVANSHLTSETFLIERP